MDDNGVGGQLAVLWLPGIYFLFCVFLFCSSFWGPPYGKVCTRQTTTERDRLSVTCGIGLFLDQRKGCHFCGPFTPSARVSPQSKLDSSLISLSSVQRYHLSQPNVEGMYSWPLHSLGVRDINHLCSWKSTCNLHS